MKRWTALLVAAEACLSESIYRVFIDISSNSTKPMQLPGIYFGQRPRNRYLTLCPVGQSCQLSNLRVGGVQMGDSAALRTALNSKTTLFIDALFFGLPKHTDVYLEVRRRDGKWQNLGGQELSISYSYFSATSIPVPENFTTSIVSELGLRS